VPVGGTESAEFAVFCPARSGSTMISSPSAASAGASLSLTESPSPHAESKRSGARRNAEAGRDSFIVDTLATAGIPFSLLHLVAPGACAAPQTQALSHNGMIRQHE